MLRRPTHQKQQNARLRTSGARRLRARLNAGLIAPAAAYLEAPAPFGAPLFVFSADADDATLLLPRDQRVLEHGRSSEVFEAITGVFVVVYDGQHALKFTLGRAGSVRGQSRRR